MYQSAENWPWEGGVIRWMLLGAGVALLCSIFLHFVSGVAIYPQVITIVGAGLLAAAAAIWKVRSLSKSETADS
jgi:K+-transporting ATPase c subunit